jgi:hypothetical protein
MKGANMEIARHWVGGGTGNESALPWENLKAFFSERDFHRQDIEDIMSQPDRIYIGDEFCPKRLPDVKSLKNQLKAADQKGLPVTFLTPVLTDGGIKAWGKLFDTFHQWDRAAEVVVNDLGVLLYLKQTFPGFSLSMGRLFNKGFKDPRLYKKNITPAAAATCFNDCSFQHANMRGLAKSLGIQRFEQDLFPHADPDPDALAMNGSDLDVSVYFPFGYVTTGRACMTAGMNGRADAKFNFSAGCHTPCTTHRFKLSHPGNGPDLLQNGNTIFYPYTASMLRHLLKTAETHGLRLVWQGGLA